MSVYRVTEVIGTSPDSWAAAARNAVETAAQTVRDLRVAEATRFDVTRCAALPGHPAPRGHLRCLASGASDPCQGTAR